MKSSYNLIGYPCNNTRTDQWNPRQVCETVWRIEGPGLDRPASDVELAIVQNAMRRALDIVRPFTEFVNVTAAGGTPEDVLRKEWGL